MTRGLPLLVLALWGCGERDARDGTFVGNPGEMDVAVTRVPAGITLEVAEFEAGDLELAGCDGDADLHVTIGSAFDALGGRDDAVEIPGGGFCGATLFPLADPGLALVGTTDAGNAFTVEVATGALVLVGPLVIDGADLLWTLPLDGLDPAALDALGNDAFLGADDPVSTAIADGVADGVGLVEDADADGLLSSGDLFLATNRALDSGLPMADAAMQSSADAGCGCDHGAPTLFAPWLAALVLVWTRVRRGRAPRR